MRFHDYEYLLIKKVGIRKVNIMKNFEYES